MGWKVGVVARRARWWRTCWRPPIAAGHRPGADRQEESRRPGSRGRRSSENEFPAFIGATARGASWVAPRGISPTPERVPPGSWTCWSSTRPVSSRWPTLAVAAAAANLLLLGDPQQLPQVSQGTHPEPADRSALGWLTDGHRHPARRARIFPCHSFRMHPALCAEVSLLSYDGRLRRGPVHRTPVPVRRRVSPAWT